MLALSIRQPYAELILRGIKTVEYRSRPTRIIGRRFHIYASKGAAAAGMAVWSRDLAWPTNRGVGANTGTRPAHLREAAGVWAGTEMRASSRDGWGRISMRTLS